MAKRRSKKPIQIASLRHAQAKRPNIPTAELETVMEEGEKKPVQVAYERRDPDLDPQLVWRGKDMTDWSDPGSEAGAGLVVQAPPLYIQEKVHPKALIDDLKREAKARAEAQAPDTPDLFADFNGLPDGEAATEFYQHEANWSNRMILGDSLQVMASLAEREGLRGRVQCIYIDPPYGIRFNSNFQWSTTTRDVKDGKAEHITREPEQVKAFRDTWRDGIHSYLTYLRDRLTVARDLLTESGSVFVQIGDENVHRVRALMDEVFGEENFVSQIVYRTTTGKASAALDSTRDFVLWYTKSLDVLKFRRPMFLREVEEDANFRFDFTPDGRLLPIEGESFRIARMNPITSQSASSTTLFEYPFYGLKFKPGKGGWKTNFVGMDRLKKSHRLIYSGKTMGFIRSFNDFGYQSYTDIWDDTRQSGFGDPKIYVVQTATRVVERCLLMTTDPGDLVLDPTCGAGTTATVAEQWGRRWITIDTSRVALALARARIMGARYPYYLLADSPEGQRKLWEITGKAPGAASSASSSPSMGEDRGGGDGDAAPGSSGSPPPEPSPIKGEGGATHNDIRQGFVYERVPHITLKAIANNAEIDEIWAQKQPAVEAALEELNAALKGHSRPFTVAAGGRKGEQVDFTTPDGETVTLPSGDEAPKNALFEWEVPREAPSGWNTPAREALERFWHARIDRQREIDAAIARNADHELLFDKPYPDKSKIRVAGPFTVESLSPHRVVAVDADDSLLVDSGQWSVESGDAAQSRATNHYPPTTDLSPQTTSFTEMVLENLRTAGVQQAHKEDRIVFSSLSGWPGEHICAEGRFSEEWSVGSEEWSVDSEEWSATDHEPPTTDHYPLSTDHQPLSTDHQPLATDHEPLSTDHYPLPTEKRAGIFIGPEFGTVARPDLVAAAREAADAGFDVLIACAFNFDAHASEFEKLGRIPVLKARMNADLHMAGELKQTASANLFVVFGEPDIEVVSGQWLVTSQGRKVICYDRLAKLPGLGGLEEINRLGGSDLPALKRLAAGGALRPDQPAAAGGRIGGGEYRGGRGAAGDEGVSSVSEHGEGLAGGDRDASGDRPAAGLSGGGNGLGDGGGQGDRAHALGAHEIAAVEGLTPADLPLALTTEHYAQITVHGVDVFKPQTGEVEASGPDGIACWFIDTNYNEESFFVRHAYFLGASDPYKALKTTLKAEIDEDAWNTLYSNVSRPFEKPESGRIAVKVINHLGDEVMKVFEVG